MNSFKKIYVQSLSNSEYLHNCAIGASRAGKINWARCRSKSSRNFGTMCRSHILKKGYKRSYKILCGIQASIEQQSESSSSLQASESCVSELNRSFQRASCCFSIPLKISQLQLRTNPLESQITMISFLNAQINHKFSTAMINSHTNSWARTTTTDHCSVLDKELRLNREYHPKVNWLLMTGALI
jgi:hypothetical protein